MKAIDLFKKAGNSLMLTVKVKDDRKRSGASGLGGGGHYDPLAHPPDNFELLPHDFDIDAEITPDVQLDYHSAFMLKPREGEQPRVAKQSTPENKTTNRFLVLDMDAEPSKGAPMIASPAALGYGPTLALPTLSQMAKAFPTNSSDATKEHDESTGSIQDQDMSLLNVSGKILDASITARHSVDFTTIGDVPASLAHLFNQQKSLGNEAPQGSEKFNLNMDELQSKQEEMLRKAQQKDRKDSAPTAVTASEEDSAKKKLAEDYQTYQFPVEDDNETDTTDSVTVNKKPASSRSVLKKVSVVSNIEVVLNVHTTITLYDCVVYRKAKTRLVNMLDSRTGNSFTRLQCFVLEQVLFSVEIIGDSAETSLEDSMTNCVSVDHLITDVHPSNMEVSFVRNHYHCNDS